MNRRQNKQKSQAKGGLKDLKDDPDHYRIKSVDSKHNVFNRKLLRKAKRKGVRDLEQYLAENTREGRKNLQQQQLKGTKAKMAAKNTQRAQASENATKQAARKELGLKDVYTKEAEQEYLQKMIEEDEREIRLYEKKLGMKKKAPKEKKFFQDFMRDDGDDLFAFLDGITKKVHTEEAPDYSGRKAFGEKDLFKDIIKARDAADKKNKTNDFEDEEVEEVEEEEEEEGDYIDEDDEDEEDEEEVDEDEDEEDEEVEEDREIEEDGEEFNEEGEEDIEGEEFDGEEGEELNEEEEGEELEFGDEEGEEFEFGEDDGEELDAEAIKKIKKQIEADAAKKLKEKLHANEEEEDENEEEQQEEEENKNPVDEEILKSRTRFDREELLKHLDPQKKLELERILRGSINRVAEGNIESIFKQLVDLYNKNPKYVISELYSDILIKSCVEQPHVLQLILATNACMLAGLFHLLGDDFLADFIRKFFLIFRENFPKVVDKSQAQNVESEGERPEIFKTRNVVLLLCFLYDFDALNEDFMQHLLFHIANNLSDDTIAYLGTVIQNSGYKIRQNNPTAVKLIMEYIQKKYEEKKVEEAEKAGQLSKKMEFIFMNINDLKHNKKMINDIQDKLTFLVGWLKKSVTSKSGKAHKRFPTRFDDIMTNDFSHPRWWMPVHILNAQQGKEPKQDFTKEILGTVQNEQLDQLEKFAFEQRFTSEIRKKIFLVIMSSDDYIDATQKLMKMKLKKQDKEIAIVIVESCAQEERFNKYYAFLAENLIRQNRSIKYSFQYAFWDHFKQLETYALRKISNLAKLLSFLVIRRALGVHVLQSLELDSLNEHQTLFVKIFFKTLLLEIDENKISDLFKAINENENFTGFREGLKDYLQEKMLKDLKKSQDGEIKELRDRIKRCCQIIKGGF